MNNKGFWKKQPGLDHYPAGPPGADPAGVKGHGDAVLCAYGTFRLTLGSLFFMVAAG